MVNGVRIAKSFVQMFEQKAGTVEHSGMLLRKIKTHPDLGGSAILGLEKRTNGETIVRMFDDKTGECFSEGVKKVSKQKIGNHVIRTKQSPNLLYSENSQIASRVYDTDGELVGGRIQYMYEHKPSVTLKYGKDWASLTDYSDDYCRHSKGFMDFSGKSNKEYKQAISSFTANRTSLDCFGNTSENGLLYNKKGLPIPFAIEMEYRLNQHSMFKPLKKLWNRMLGRPEPQDPVMRTMREEAAKVYPNTQKYYSDEVNMAIRNRQAFLPGQHLDNVKVS